MRPTSSKTTKARTMQTSKTPINLQNKLENMKDDNYLRIFYTRKNILEKGEANRKGDSGGHYRPQKR